MKVCGFTSSLGPVTVVAENVAFCSPVSKAETRIHFTGNTPAINVYAPFHVVSAFLAGSSSVLDHTPAQTKRPRTAKRKGKA